MSGEFTADKQLKNRAESIIIQVEQLEILSTEDKDRIYKIIKKALKKLNSQCSTKL